MKNNRSLILILLVVAILAGLFYFFQQRQGEVDTSKKIGFLVPTLENPFFVDMTESAKSLETEDLKVLIQADKDELKQNQIIDNFITQGVDAICVVPINSESIIPAVVNANKANIPIINVDNKINMTSANAQGAKIGFYIGSDNFEGGQSAGKYMIEQLGGSGNVAILEGVAGNDAAIKRKGGFEDVLKSTPNIKIISSQAADWNRQKANDIFQGILAANPNLDGVFACNDEMALGVIAALKSNNISLDSIVVVGFDAVDEAVQAVKDGELNATIAQQPKLMGKRAVDLVLSMLKGESVNKNYSTPLKVIN